MALDIYQGSVADETGRYGLMLNPLPSEYP